jgi:stage V sporulation protein R
MDAPYDTTLPPHLRALKEEIEGYARDYGLDFYETIFEVIDADDLNEVAAYGGFPTRYPHWSFGMQYEELKKGYDYGLSKIYEMVINNDPCYAYLMRSNHTVDQKLVMAHVYGHCDFFKNNAYFGHTSRKMMDEMANHGTRIRSYTEKYGEDEVEAFMDRCMSIDDLIDIHSTAIRRRAPSARYDFAPEGEEDVRATRFKSKDYMDAYINPQDVLKAEEDERRKQKEQTARSFPENPEKDILLFLIEYAPLKAWQRDILSIVRDEAYYFAPQGQTKIMNEGWACLVGDSLVLTDRGIMRMDELVEQCAKVRVADGTGTQRVYDWAKFENRRTVKIRTRLGFEIEGSETHQVQLADGTWKRLDAVKMGDRVKLPVGTELWAQEEQAIEWSPNFEAGDAAEQSSAGGTAVLTRKATRFPTVVDERLGAFLGYIVKAGAIAEDFASVTFQHPEDTVVQRVGRLGRELFGLTEGEIRRTSSVPSLEFTSPELPEFLNSLGLLRGQSWRTFGIPEIILRSPRSVVVSFLQTYFWGVEFNETLGNPLEWSFQPTTDSEMAQTLQLILLNLGIITERQGRQSLRIACNNLLRFASMLGWKDEVDFTLGSAQDPIWVMPTEPEDEIISISEGRADVFDISVENTHCYVASGLVNHNSYWHSTIMTQKALSPSELVDYADHHSGTMAMSRTRLNPYKLGIELLRDIEFRWNTGRFGKEYEECDDLEKKRTWNKELGLGRQKIFEVRRIHNDITFIENFLTPEFCVQHNFFSFAYQEQGGQYIIESREFEKIKQRLLFSLTNFGKPWIYVIDGNHKNRGELLLKHHHTGVELKLDHAADTLANIQYIWGRPVHLHTLVDGKPTTLSFDGTDHSIRTGGDNDDARRSPPAKTR